MLIFFDESGKRDDHPILMGGLSIPKDIYLRKEFCDLQGTRTHWADFKPQPSIKKLIRLAANFEEVIKINIINYDYMAIQKAAERFTPRHKEFAERTIYAKFPERIFYGLLRKNLNYIESEAEVIIEKASEYERYVKDVVGNHLNVQALYRGESFKVNSCELKSKGEDVGLEITDLMLGIVRFIIKNEPITKSKRHSRKTRFVIDLLKEEKIYNLFSKRIMFFEWTKMDSLKEVSFDIYLKSFISKNADLWY